MELWILDRNFEQIGVVDDYKSLIWSKRYNELGDCEIYIGASDRTISLFQKGHYILRADDDMICRIERIEIDTDTEEGNFLVVTGYDCRKILNQRIVWWQTNFTGTAEDFIRTIIMNNVINPPETRRRIPHFTLGASKGFTDRVEIQSTYDYLFDKIKEICATYGYGSRLTYNGSDFTFELYKGVNRSVAQYTNDVVIFSPDFENLISTNYVNDSSEIKTAALVAGEGEGAQRTRRELGGGTGFNRYELFVDAKDISSTTEDDHQMTPQEYQALLQQRGEEKLAENITLISFDGQVEPNYSYKYGEDYFLGDIVTVRNEYGIQANARITEVIESHDDNGYSIIPTFEYVENEGGDYLLSEDGEVLTTEDGEPIEY